MKFSLNCSTALFVKHSHLGNNNFFIVKKEEKKKTLFVPLKTICALFHNFMPIKALQKYGVHRDCKSRDGMSK